MKTKNRFLLILTLSAVPCILVACSGSPVPPPNLPAPEYEAPRSAGSAVPASSSSRANQSPDPTDVPLDDAPAASPASSSAAPKK